MECPKCKGEMEQGFISNKLPGRFDIKAAQWSLGEPVSNMFVKPKLFYIESFRCKNCGYLESYAK